jgi:hypothetical protein
MPLANVRGAEIEAELAAVFIDFLGRARTAKR